MFTWFFVISLLGVAYYGIDRWIRVSAFNRYRVALTKACQLYDSSHNMAYVHEKLTKMGYNDSYIQELLYAVKGINDAKEEQEREAMAQRRPGGGRKNNSLYDILNVAPDATIKQIKAAYHVQMRIYHPDMHPEKLSEQERLHHQEMLIMVRDAYTILSNAATRKTYDQGDYIG